MIDYHNLYPEAYEAGAKALLDFNCDVAGRREAFDRINQQPGYGEQAAFVQGWMDAERKAEEEAKFYGYC